jgi:hypothetical protein
MADDDQPRGHRRPSPSADLGTQRGLLLVVGGYGSHSGSSRRSPPQVGHVADINAWSRAHYETRRDEPWDDVWVGLHAARKALLEVLEGIGQADLAWPFHFP